MNWESMKRLVRDGLKWGWHKVASFWKSRGILWKTILGLGAIISLVNGAVSLYDRLYGESKSTYHTSEKWVQGGSAELKGEPPPKLPTVKAFLPTNQADVAMMAREDVSFLIGRMRDAYEHGDYTNAAKFAAVADGHMRNVATNSFVHERLSILPVLIGEAFFNGNYAKVREMIANMKKMKGVVVAETPAYRALRDVSARLENGTESEIFFFSSEELGRLRDWDQGFLEEYLSCLSAWGYLHPIMLDPRSRNHHTFYYEEFFGFKKPLPYRPRVCMAVTNVDGNVAYSNEASSRWCGRDRSVPVDIDECIAKALRLRENEKYHHGVKLNLEGVDGGRRFRANWSYSSAYKIPTNAVAKIREFLPWMPGKEQPLTELNTVYLTRTNQQVVSYSYIPRAIWIVIFTLICMAFAPQGGSADGSDKTKMLGNNNSHRHRGADNGLGVLTMNQLYAILFGCSVAFSVVMHFYGSSQRASKWWDYGGAIFDSVIAGVVVAYLADRCLKMNEARKSKLARDAYFAELRSELLKTLARIVWFDSCLGDSKFNWNLNPKLYWEVPYTKMIWATHPSFSLDYAQAISRLDEIKAAHSPSGLEKMNHQHVQKIATMYRIIVFGSTRLVELMKAVERDRILLAKNEMMPYVQTKDVVKSIQLVLDFFLNLNGTNYGAAIDQVLGLLKTVGDREFREKGLTAWLN